MRKNVIILTTGLSGSSPLVGLIARGGYWTGDQTFKKRDYDTFENEELIRLNQSLFRQIGYDGKYEMEFSADAIKAITLSADRVDPAPFREFIRKCNGHNPWIWKDPRLWLTIRYWQPFLDLDEIQFVVLHRDDLQTWISTTIRRQIHSYEYSKKYTAQVHDSIGGFLREFDRPHLDVQFEELVMHPESVVGKLNDYLDISLTMDDVHAVYTKPLRRMPRGKRDLLKASLIYLKNYRSRYR